MHCNTAAIMQHPFDHKHNRLRQQSPHRTLYCSLQSYEQRRSKSRAESPAGISPVKKVIHHHMVFYQHSSTRSDGIFLYEEPYDCRETGNPQFLDATSTACITSDTYRRTADIPVDFSAARSEGRPDRYKLSRLRRRKLQR